MKIVNLKLTKFLFFCLLMGSMSVVSSCKKDTTDEPEKKPDNYYRIYNLEKGFYLSTKKPHQVNMLFQVLDKNYKGVTGLYDKNKYIITENGSPLSVEAKPVIDTFGSIPFTIKTVLLLDISSSVEGMVADIKNAAIEMINNKSDKQEIAIYTFDSKSKVIQNFTTNKNLLINGIKSIPETNLVSSTNIYGTLIDVSNLYKDAYNLNQITQGSIVLFTDGNETTGSKTLSEAQYALGTKKVFVLGLKSQDLDEQNLKTLSSDGSIVYANNITEVKDKFLEIQNDIIRLSKSVYWLYYQSPKRGNNVHDLEIRIKDNTNSGIDGDAVASGSYTSADFTD